jgi:hypothetical protein
MSSNELDKTNASLPEAMTGKASPAKAAVGDKPVFAYIASLPQRQRGIAEAVDALAARWRLRSAVNSVGAVRATA